MTATRLSIFTTVDKASPRLMRILCGFSRARFTPSQFQSIFSGTGLKGLEPRTLFLFDLGTLETDDEPDRGIDIIVTICEGGFSVLTGFNQGRHGRHNIH